jgi:hypothetical protein
VNDFEEQSLIPMLEPTETSSLKLDLIPEYQTIGSEIKRLDLVARLSTLGNQIRAPIDMVAVIDKSASMKGEKITLVKRILQFILSKLNEHDRLSIVTFDNSVYGVFGLRRCDGSPILVDRIRTSEYLIPNAGTNIKLGLERGLKVLNDRQQQNPITAMLLLTDGMGIIPSDEELSQLGGIPIHCFGIGTDHDARILNKIAEQTTGSYVFIEETHQIRDTLALCLGSLLSIAGQDIKITITSPQAEHIIPKTTHSFTSLENSVTITIPNILFEEHKDILFSCDVPQSDCALLCSAMGSYRNPMVEQVIESVHIIVNRGSESTSRCLAVDQERNRVSGVQALIDAIAYGEQGKLDLARDRLLTIISEIKNSLTANEPIVQNIIFDLETCLHRFEDEHSYRTLGYAYAEQQYRSHSLQRSLNISTPSSYLTKTQSTYLN